jgi:predicted nucleic acid-binding protein
MVDCLRLLDDLAEVLARPKFARSAAQDRGIAYVAAFAARGAVIPTRRSRRRPFRDPRDDLVALARVDNADVLVSIDNDLLEASVDDVTIWRPAILIDRLDGV